MLSEVAYPAWRASVDGKPVPLAVADHALRAVPVPAGTHTVRFVYRPPLFYGSAIISGLAVGVVLLLAVVHLARSARAYSRAAPST